MRQAMRSLTLRVTRFAVVVKEVALALSSLLSLEDSKLLVLAHV